MRLATIFGLSLATGAAIVHLTLGRESDVPGTTDTTATSPVEREAPAPSPTTSPTVGAAGTGPPQVAPAAERPRAPADEPTPAEVAAAKAAHLAARERLSRAELRDLLEGALEGRLADRELAPHDYGRLADAVLRLRSAQRVLRNMDESAATAALLDDQRRKLLAALAEMEDITGVPTANLGEVLGSDGEPWSDDGGPPDESGP